MPTVPYQPYASEKPTESSGASSLRIDAPSAAFGGAVGQALGTLGKQFEHTGDELFRRAVEIQNLQNETEAKEADADYMVKVGKLHAEYGALQGKAAVDAYPKYMQDVQDLRREVRNSLSNPMAQKLYDGSSLSTMGRTIFNGAGHAATEGKRWAIGASEARISTLKQNIFQNPQDDDLYEQGIGVIKVEMADQGALRGWDRNQTDEATRREISDTLAHRITGLARVAPWEAERMLEKYKDQLHWKDAERVNNTVLTQIHTTASANLAEDLVSKNSNAEKPKSMDELVTEAQKKAAEIRPGDETLQRVVKDAVIARWKKQESIDKEQLQTHRQTLWDGVGGMYSKDGALPTTVQELTSTPETRAAWDALPEQERRKFEKALVANASGDFNPTPDRKRNFYRLLGMSGDPEQRAEFKDLDLGKEDLTLQQRQQLIKIQRQTQVKFEEDPRVARAMDRLKPILQPKGITQKDDPTLYNYFRGSMQTVIEDYVRQYGKQPPPEEIDKMGARLMQEQYDATGWHWGGLRTPKTRIFEQKMPEEEKERYRNDPEFKKPGMAPPTDEQLDFEHVRRQYNKFFSKPPKKDQSQVPNRNLPGQ